MTDLPAASDTFDVVVIGGGPPGENAADYVVKGGLSAALVEVDLVGGECSYWACMPSKALLRSVETLDLAHHVPGVPVGDRLDIGSVLDNRDKFTHHHDDSSQVEWAEGAHITVIRGRGRLAGEKRVDVTAPDGTTRTLTARHAVVVATGTSAAIPPIDGLREAQPWTSRDVTNLHTVPARIVVIGGGVVACEAATWLIGLGAQVTVLCREERLLEHNEPFAGELLADRLRQDGADVRLNVTTEQVRRGPISTTDEGEPRGSEVTVTADGEAIVADEVLIAAGRTPNSGDLGLDSIGLARDGYLSTDDTMLVDDVPGGWLYAVGDITGRALLTHMGKYQARVCGDVIAARAKGEPTDARRFRASSDHGAVPQVTFSTPQVASVGLTEAHARAAGTPVRTVSYDIGSVAGAALLRNDFVGRAQLVVDTSDETLVGATFVGPDVAELVHAATIAVVGKVPLDVLWHAVPSYPTVSEIWLRLLETWRAEAA
ncbi:MAG TPA: NAD(P)/FAD-dependent oxidoreductase [Mycobacteriales bacterium]|nr:NAD(P)/FAD-dependent oxidoreductase [Mycobacteriales bacterium]